MLRLILWCESPVIYWRFRREWLRSAGGNLLRSTQANKILLDFCELASKECCLIPLDCRRTPLAPRLFLRIPDTYPIHTRRIPDTYEYSMNIPWTLREYPIAQRSIGEASSAPLLKHPQWNIISEPMRWSKCAKKWKRLRSFKGLFQKNATFLLKNLHIPFIFSNFAR